MYEKQFMSLLLCMSRTLLGIKSMSLLLSMCLFYEAMLGDVLLNMYAMILIRSFFTCVDYYVCVAIYYV